MRSSFRFKKHLKVGIQNSIEAREDTIKYQIWITSYSYQKNQTEKGRWKWQHHCFLHFLLHGHRTKICPILCRKKWKLCNRHYYICLCTWLKVHSSYTNDFRNWTKQMTLLSVTQCISKCLIIFQQLVFESFLNLL